MIKTFDSQKSLIKKIVFIDGIPRSGKTAMAPVLSSLHHSESIEFCNFLELSESEKIFVSLKSTNKQ